MPLITYDAPVNRISGRSSNQPSTYTFNNGQPVIRSQPNVSNPDTVNQQTIRAIFSTVTKNWKALTQNQRDAWSTWATSHTVTNRLGRTVSRNGLSAYTELATMNYLRTGSLLSSAPALAQPSPATAIDIPASQNASNTLFFTVDHGYTTLTGLYLVSRATPAVQYQSQTPKLGDYRLIQGVDDSSIIALAASGGTYTFTDTEYEYHDGIYVGVECSIMNAEGWQSSPFRVFGYYAV